MDDQEMGKYRDRWVAVAEIERQELRAQSPAQSWRELNAILRLAIGLKLPLTDRDEGLDAVRQRWLTLKLSHKP